MKVILIVGMVLLSCFCTGQEDQDRHYAEGGHHGGHHRPHYDPYYRPPYHHHPHPHPYGRWKRETPEANVPLIDVPLIDSPKIYAHEHLKPIEDILGELGQKLGSQCVAVLVCNSASNPLFYGHFGEQIIDYFSRPLLPLTDFLSSYALAMRLQDATLCRRNLAECSRTDLELRDLAAKYYL